MRHLLLVLVFVAGHLNAQQFFCDAPPFTGTLPPAAYATPDATIDYCAKVKIEVDLTTLNLLGGLSAAQVQVESTLNDVATIFRQSALTHYNIDLQLDFEVFYWETVSPYTGPTSTQYLLSYKENYQPHNGVVTQLLASGSSGGVAWLNSLCNEDFGLSFSNFLSQDGNYPNYYWNAMVIAHELGHNFGSPHSHACAWNGNNTAVDGCAGVTEGPCPIPPNPLDGGSIMSYCHLVPSVGINFLKGFTAQETALILNSVAAANCGYCDSEPPPPPPTGCEENEIFLTVDLDAYPTETTWNIIDENGATVAASGAYTKADAFLSVTDTFCLPDGCYYFQIIDVDGMTGTLCGNGGYSVLNESGGVIGSGGNFESSAGFGFCFNNQSDCEVPGFDELNSYANQDAGGEVTVSGDVMRMSGNTWKAKDWVYTVTPFTYVILDLKIDREGEIHGVGFTKSDGFLSPQHTFRLAGSQNWWGIDLMDDDNTALGMWRTYEIPVGQVFEQEGELGEFLHFIYVNDHDGGSRDADSYFRNVEVCEYSATELAQNKKRLKYTIGRGLEFPTNAFKQAPFSTFYPNPAQSVLNLPKGEKYTIYDNAGAVIETGTGLQIDVSRLPAGVYFVRQGERVGKIIVQ